MTKIALIPVKGPIMSEGNNFLSLTPGLLTPKRTKKMLEKAEEETDGVILQINSPGGSPFPSKEIAEKIQELEVPTVAQIRENGLSGAYWIASASDRIVADELSKVGGIGVAAVQPDFTELLEKVGINIDSSTTGEFKEGGMPFGGMDKNNEFMEEQLETINEIFTDSVAESRDLDRSKTEEIFEGKPYLGKKAKEIGLIDRLGRKKEAIEECKTLMDVDDVEVIDYGEKTGGSKGLEGMMEQFMGS